MAKRYDTRVRSSRLVTRLWLIFVGKRTERLFALAMTHACRGGKKAEDNFGDYHGWC